MTRLANLLTALLALIVVAGVNVRDPRIAERAVRLRAGVVDTTAGSLARAIFGAERDDDKRPNADEVRGQIRRGQPGTYIGEVLVARDSAIARWRDRRDAPLRVWVQNARHIRDFDPSFVGLVQKAFVDWSDTGIPVAFWFVRDSIHADVHVTWVDRFDDLISGKTLWSHDERWWIVEANIQLAVHHHSGERLDGSAVRAISLHEVGHLIGLDHTSDTSNIMTPKVRVRELSQADQATARLLYSLPPGALR